jgi:hypothetical protein
MSYLKRTVTIANGDTTSNAVNAPGGYVLCAVGCPAALDGTAITLDFEGRTVSAFTDGSTPYSLTFGANACIPLDPGVMAAVHSVALVADTQSADREFDLYFLNVGIQGRGY